ncbi:MtnX-like HAD-IB family phosphatase [Macrococcoides canis]|uniref:MtnX-like HAD-IB family phosphatase n=1 Tax=Macrococcoides canis TaxID=1855823 RepID=UPI0020B80FB0|nr:MtnX-like HAD-IB family phosphatase [Macrococcus canis]UTH02274.1 MtnX-like HAD-IB family phosphatase [Macrococcus canis]
MGYIIACDFDGTVTSTDTIAAIIEQFEPVHGNAIVERIMSREISIKTGVSELFNLLNSTDKDAVIQYALEEVAIRPGFQQLLDKAAEKHIPFYIISGGMHFFIDPILSQFHGIKEVFANEVDFTEDYMKVIWTHPCDIHCDNDCGTCKPSIVRRIAGNRKVIAIGDSVTDILLAQEADILFTTDKLSEYAQTNNIDHQHFETFYDIEEQLEEVIH